MNRPDRPASILDSLTTAVLTLDQRLHVVDANSAAEMMFALSRRKLKGRDIRELVGRESALAQAMHQSLADSSTVTAREVELALFPPAQGRLTIDCTLVPAQGDSGYALVAELTQVDRILRLARDEFLLDISEANKEVLAGLAHEIKNPLGGLRGAAQLLARELGESELREYTQVIVVEADRLSNLVDRMAGPRGAARPQWINVHELLEHLRRLVLAEVPEELNVVRDYDPSLPDIKADREQLIQALLNIVRNAMQAMQGQGCLRIRTRVERMFTIGHVRHRQVARIDIEDNGPGIPEPLRERIFYPLVTGRADGSGLGLAITHDIISRHGGLIEYSSRPACTIFTIYLPLETNDETA